MFKEKREVSTINKILISMLVVVCIFAIAIILLTLLNKNNTETHVKETQDMIVNYTTTEENAWDISANGDGSVIATLSEDGTLTISGTGDLKDWDYNATTDWHNSQIKEKVKNVIIKEGVTSIGDSAFYGCSSLASIEIPDGVTSIGDYVFDGCSSLTSINIPSGVTSIEYCVFRGCSSLTSIKIPDGATSIGISAFYGCSSLTSINIPSSITNIEALAFRGCSSLKEIKVDENNTKYSDDNGVLYTKHKTSIIRYPEGKEDTIYTIPKGVTNIGNWALAGCKSLICINIQSSVRSIGNSAFSGCSSLEEIKVDKNNTKYMDDNGVLYTKDIKEITKFPEGKDDITYRIIEGVTSIGDYAFYRCRSLTSLNIPDGVTNIGDSAFSECEKMQLEIPSSVTDIGSNAFYGCKNLMIICEIDSTAHNYSKENKIDYLVTRYNKVNNHFKGIQPDITYENFIKNIETNSEFKVTEDGQNVTGNTLIKTGQQLVIDNQIFTLVVIGDTNGDGQADLKDILAINKHRLNKAQLTDEYLLAGDVNEDEKSDLRDILRINKYRLGKISEL